MFEELAFPVVAAPMAGGPSTPELVAAVSNLGGYGFLPAGYLSSQQLKLQIKKTRDLTDKPFGVNLFVPGKESTVDISAYAGILAREAEHYGTFAGSAIWDDDDYSAKLDLVVKERIPLVSFTFGMPSLAEVQRLHEAGAEILITVTTPDEAELAAERGADALCVQGFEAGGHRGLFNDDPTQSAGGEIYGLLSALRLISAVTDLPLVATGGLVHGADVVAVLAAGACAAQLGTAFLMAEESGTNETYRRAVLDAEATTVFTRAFSGRPARGVSNRFIVEHSDSAPAAYPQINNLSRPIRAAAAKMGDAEAMSLWAGQTFSLARQGSVAEIMTRLKEEFDEAVARLTLRFG